MVFNSLEFFIFFPIVYLLYLVLPHRGQNIMLLVASYIFYGAWDWRFLSLIFISTVIDYFCGLEIGRSRDVRRKRLFLIVSMCGNLGILGFFKYFNFFVGNLQVLLQEGMNIPAHFDTLNIILPVGISFYTFQTMSYTIDVYRGELKAERNFLDFALFVAFFPQLVAGPIERAVHLLPQMTRPRRLSIEQFSEGCYLILWGFFQKVFVADNLAKIADPIFAPGGGPYNGFEVMVGIYAFAFQIFGDFAGYSNMARGLSKLMGVDIMFNFNLPYFAKNPSDFWKRWHISLSTWLRDYLYIPLGGNRKGELNTYRNLLLTMLLGGLWHGAAWTFIMWGAYHGLLLVLHRFFLPLLERLSRPFASLSPGGWSALRIIFFFHLVCLGWLFFRAQSVSQINEMLQAVFISWNGVTSDMLREGAILALVAAPLLLINFFQYLRNDLYFIFRTHWALQGVFYFVILFLTVVFGAGGNKEFIYFQF